MIMHLIMECYLLFSLFSICLASTSMPVVDLGYELHQAISLDETTQTYNFSNIRYAAPPIDDRRFLPPLPPIENRTEIQNGSVGRVCPQGVPIWSAEIMVPFLESVLLGTQFNQSGNVSDYPVVWPPGDSRITEDCLFLDAVVPKGVFEGRSGGGDASAPVLVWINGGGYIAGDKSERDPKGLFMRSMDTGEEFIYVALNYRLGAFGWLSDTEGMANAGLYDQRLALEWVRQYIGLFGGDLSRVTVMGESAGGGSIIHQIAAVARGPNGTADDLPFQQAIIQSPTWYPLSVEQQQSNLRQFLDLLNVTSIQEARRLPSSQLMAANAHQIATTPVYGTFTYGPVVDGSLVPDLPSRAMLAPNFKWKNLRVMTSHTSNEGLAFTPPDGANSTAYPSIIEAYVPSLTPEVMEDIARNFYPPRYNISSAESLGYGSPLERTALTVSDAFFRCKNLYLNSVFDTAYASVFNVQPALHSQDLAFTFYNHSRPDMKVGLFDEELAFTMQDYIISFVRQGYPSSANATDWEVYANDGHVLNMELQDVAMIADPIDKNRCRLWWNLSG
ncbi:carboxylesterase family protein [Aspergillus sclerotioniger CBS 115572]|uniref:Carboxylic ester hydrolase n=1 Tax=Aspergillus sclerotioniger CBS 115572 TaxID=1450535 RepID=A0A317XDL9_9EURO|nr:carboxylesterase family protein [Aspergillus sclerotioniger CBS 115572]PWY94630.1 carboxylesterase family protein [Aspergillus sclerotioniger CBS 115572]